MTQNLTSAKADVAPAPARAPRSRERAAKAAKARIRRERTIGTAAIVVGLIGWYVAAKWIVSDPLFLPTPIQTWHGITTMWSSGRLKDDLIASAQEFVIGFVLGSLAGTIIGALMAKVALIRTVLNPYVSAFNATPILALSPIVILWFGLGITSHVVVIVSVVIFQQIINTEAGIRSVDPGLREVARVYGAGPLAVFFKIDLWWSLPYMLAGLKAGIGRALVGVVVAELFGARSGIGLAIFNAQNNFNMSQVFGGVAILAVSGIGLTGLLGYIERRATPWVERG